MLATGKSSPVIDWLRALAARRARALRRARRRRHRHVLHRRLRVGDGDAPEPAGAGPQPAVVCPSSSPWKKQNAHNIDISPEELDVVKGRCAAEGLTVLGMRFKGDSFVPGARFDFLREQLGDAFVAIELDDDARQPELAR